MSDTHNVFISHRHEDDHLIGKFKDLMDGRGVTVRDSSIDSADPNNAKNPEYIKDKYLRPGIRWAGKVVVLITPDTKNHPWVDYEIECALRLDKPVIGVWAPGSEGCALPDALEKYADAVVSWDSGRIADALNGDRTFEDSAGDARSPQELSRIGC
jgi:Thoeris protein ThsB, TIR-like domain